MSADHEHAISTFLPTVGPIPENNLYKDEVHESDGYSDIINQVEEDVNEYDAGPHVACCADMVGKPSAYSKWVSHVSGVPCPGGDELAVGDRGSLCRRNRDRKFLKFHVHGMVPQT